MATGWPMKTTYANGDVYSAGDVNDTNGTINLLGASVAYAAGKNAVINGDLYINQRNFTSNTTNGTFNFDRFSQLNSGGTVTVTPQTFTPGAAPVVGYEGKNFVRMVTASQSAAGDFAIMRYQIEDTRTFANQLVTFSFWAKAASGTPKITVEADQNYGVGGAGGASLTTMGTVTLSTSWTRYTVSGTLPSLSGKTIGTGSYINIYYWVSAGTTFASRTNSMGIQNNTFDMWGFQIEEGSTATAFQTATGTIQGELAACQRYYYRQTAQQVYSVITTTQNISTTQTIAAYTMPVTMRVAPTAVEFSTLALQEYSTGGLSAVTVLTLEGNVGGLNTQSLLFTVSSGLTTNRVTRVLCNNSLSAYLGLSAEL